MFLIRKPPCLLRNIYLCMQDLPSDSFIRKFIWKPAASVSLIRKPYGSPRASYVAFICVCRISLPFLSFGSPFGSPREQQVEVGKLSSSSQKQKISQPRLHCKATMKHSTFSIFVTMFALILACATAADNNKKHLRSLSTNPTGGPDDLPGDILDTDDPLSSRLLKKDVNEPCTWHSDCQNGACGRLAYGDGDVKVCCPSKNVVVNAGYRYCTLSPEGTKCKWDNQCIGDCAKTCDDCGYKCCADSSHYKFGRGWFCN